MAEYISKDQLHEITKPFKDSFLSFLTDEVDRLVDTIEPADVQAVKHGRWVQDAVYVDETTGEPCLAWFCNQCGEPQMVGTNYCPNCGARMDGEA